MIVKFNPMRSRFEAEWGRDEFKVAYPVVKAAGFAFDSENKVWHSAGYKAPKPMSEQKVIACRLWDYLDASAIEFLGPKAADLKAEAAAPAEAKQVALKASRATDSLAEILAPAGLTYLSFQKAGIAYAMGRPSTLIADEMGLGKTIQAIGVSNSDPSIRRILIVCPASLKLNWKREWEKWDTKGLTVGIVNGAFPKTDVVIINYDLVGDDIVKKSRGRTVTIKKWRDELKAAPWDLLVVDECHKCKNPDAGRTQHILGRKASKRKNKETGKMEPTAPIAPIPALRSVFLTGTPICNRPIELWPLVEALDPNGLGRSFWGFAERYCNATKTRFGWDFKGASNLPELQENLRSTIMVRRLKSEVLTELPAKRRQVILIQPDIKGRELIEKEKQAWDRVQATEGDAVALAEMSKVRHEIALYTAPFGIAQADDLLEDDGLGKLVCFCHHQDVATQIFKHFGDAAVMVHGAVSLANRQAAVDRFQTDPTCKVFVGTIQAAGVGLTLTAACDVLFFEEDWVPGNVTQAEDRCHRIGQRNAVNIQHIILDESLMVKMISMLIDKQAVIDAALDTKPEPVTPQEMPKVGVPEAPKPGEARTVEIKGKKITLMPAQVEAIHSGLKMLRAKCDGAHDDDGAGFSGADVQFGWSMAAAPNLSLKQAAYGQNLIRKYQGQLPAELVRAAGVEMKQ